MKSTKFYVNKEKYIKLINKKNSFVKVITNDSCNFYFYDKNNNQYMLSIDWFHENYYNSDLKNIYELNQYNQPNQKYLKLDNNFIPENFPNLEIIILKTPNITCASILGIFNNNKAQIIYKYWHPIDIVSYNSDDLEKIRDRIVEISCIVVDRNINIINTNNCKKYTFKSIQNFENIQSEFLDNFLDKKVELNCSYFYNKYIKNYSEICQEIVKTKYPNISLSIGIVYNKKYKFKSN